MQAGDKIKLKRNRGIASAGMEGEITNIRSGSDWGVKFPGWTDGHNLSNSLEEEDLAMCGQHEYFIQYDREDRGGRYSAVRFVAKDNTKIYPGGAFETIVREATKTEIEWHFPDTREPLTNPCKEVPISQQEVFSGIFVGDIVVSLATLEASRKSGDMFIVQEDSCHGTLKYKTKEGGERSSGNKFSWRLATPDEVVSYRTGTRSIEGSKNFISSQTTTLDHVKHKQVRSNTAKVREGERLCEDRLQGRKGKTQLRVDPISYQGSRIRSKSKTGRIKG